MMNEYNVYKPTDEQWYGSYQLVNGAGGGSMACQVGFVGNISPPTELPRSMVHVSGTDDYAMVYISESESDAFNKFLQVIGWPRVSKEALKELGFTFD